MKCVCACEFVCLFHNRTLHPKNDGSIKKIDELTRECFFFIFLLIKWKIFSINYFIFILDLFVLEQSIFNCWVNNRFFFCQIDICFFLLRLNMEKKLCFFIHFFLLWTHHTLIEFVCKKFLVISYHSLTIQGRNMRKNCNSSFEQQQKSH